MLFFVPKGWRKLAEQAGLDLITFGQRLKYFRRARGYTLADLGSRVGRAPSVLSLLENGRREPKLSLIEQLARALSVPVQELLSHQPPSRRAQLEIAVEEAQRDSSYSQLGLPHLKIGSRQNRRARPTRHCAARCGSAATTSPP